MNKKKLIKILKDNDVEVTPVIETAIGEAFKDTKIFPTAEVLNTYVESKINEYKENEEKLIKRENLIKEKLSKARVKEEYIKAFVKLTDLNDVEDTEIDKVIAEGVKQYPYLKDIGSAPVTPAVERKSEDVKKEAKVYTREEAQTKFKNNIFA